MIAVARSAIWGVALMLPLAGIQLGSAAGADLKGPAAALSALQAAHAADGNTFVIQRELDGLIHQDGGGACASAAGIDLLQALRLMAGLDKLPNPHKVVLSSFQDQPVLLDGRVSNEQFVRLIEFYQVHLDGAEL